jgi:hypothetical protein
MLNLFDLVKDPYERKARVTPGLLVSLPILVPLVCVYGPKQPTLTAVVGLLGGCGAIYALASIARGRGKKLEEDLVNKWGGMPSTLALRHRDKFFDRVTKQRYHADICSKLGIAMPTADQEAAEPAAADETYMGATRRLRELTRGDKQLLLKENIAYGFHRNMLAMKGMGLLTSIVGLVYGLVIAGVLQLKPLGATLANLGDPGLAGGLTLLVSLAMLLAWCFYFDEDKVRRIGFAYAERLFEHLPSLSGAPKARAPRTKKAGNTAMGGGAAP